MCVVRCLVFAGLAAVITPFAQGQSIGDLVAQDQADRLNKPVDWPAVRERDTARRHQVLQLLRDGAIKTAADHESAALIFQHGATPDDYRLAHALATLATALDPERSHSLWLQAASWDRLLLALGKKQWYGTQFIRGANGKMELQPMDRDAVSDAERARLGVPPALP